MRARPAKGGKRGSQKGAPSANTLIKSSTSRRSKPATQSVARRCSGRGVSIRRPWSCGYRVSTRAYRRRKSGLSRRGLAFPPLPDSAAAEGESQSGPPAPNQIRGGVARHALFSGSRKWRSGDDLARRVRPGAEIRLRRPQRRRGRDQGFRDRIRSATVPSRRDSARGSFFGGLAASGWHTANQNGEPVQILVMNLLVEART